jgi:uncharacterized damage-inducible protein DinB
MIDGIRFSELLAYNQLETARWKEWFRNHPEAFDAACDIAGGTTVKDLLFHVFFVELHFAHKVLSLPKPEYKAVPRATLDELFSVSEQAAHKTKQFLESSAPEAWAEALPLGFRDVKATRRKMLAQAFLHGVHHRGQLAVILRQQGFKDLWVHDIVLTNALE